MAQREINCQDVSARMMELLYGELSGDDRAAIEADVLIPVTGGFAPLIRDVHQTYANRIVGF